MNKAAKADFKTYQKVNIYYAYKYGTDAKIIEHVRTWYGMKISKDKMLEIAKNQKTKKQYYKKLADFIERLTDEEMKDVNKYWARIDPRILI